MMRWFFKLLVSSSVLCLSLAAQAQQPSSSITGLLHLQNGQFPGGRVEVLLESDGMPIATSYSDDEGRFGFQQALGGGTYHVVIQDDSYISVDQRVDIDPLFPQHMVLNIYLTPKNAASSSMAAPVGAGPDSRMMRASATGENAQSTQRGSNPYLVSPKELARNYPKDAVKEWEKAGESREKGKLDDAIKHYQKAIERAPDFYAAHNDLGTVYLEKREFALAETEFQSAVKSNPSDPDAYINLGNADLLTGNLQEGLRYVQQGLTKQPNSGLGLFVEGALYRRLGNFKDAENSLRNSLQADPSLANAHLELVNLYREENNRPAVVAELQAFLRLYPKNPFVPQVKSTLEKLNAPMAPQAPAPTLISH